MGPDKDDRPGRRQAVGAEVEIHSFFAGGKRCGIGQWTFRLGGEYSGDLDGSLMLGVDLRGKRALFHTGAMELAIWVQVGRGQGRIDTAKGEQGCGRAEDKSAEEVAQDKNLTSESRAITEPSFCWIFRGAKTIG